MENESGRNEVIYGVCLQDTEEEFEVFQSHFGDHERVKVEFIPYTKSQGVCRARKLLREMVTDEDYFLQMDSHMRSIPEWDAAMIESLEATRCERPILSAYPPHYEPGDTEKSYLETSRFMNVTEFSLPVKRSHSHHGCGPKFLNETGVPVRNLRVSAGFHFAPAAWLQEAAYADHYYWEGEEDELTILSYTMGWSIFCPERVLVYHCGINNLLESSEKYRPLHWEDHPEMAYSKKLFRKFSVEDLALGSERTLDDYFRDLTHFTENFQWFELSIELASENEAESALFELFDRDGDTVFQRNIKEKSLLRGESRVLFLKIDRPTLHRSYGYRISVYTDRLEETNPQVVLQEVHFLPSGVDS